MDINVPAILEQLKALVAENASLQSTIGEMKDFTALRENELRTLKLEIATIAETKSKLDNQSLELEILQDHMDSLQQKAAGAKNIETGLRQEMSKSISEHHQLENLQHQYTYLQAQFEALQNQLQEANNRNLILQQQTSRMAEKESLLANAFLERDEWKALAELRKG